MHPLCSKLPVIGSHSRFASLILLCALSLSAQNTNKKPAPAPAKSAPAPAKPAPATGVHPAGSTAGGAKPNGPTTGTHGPTATSGGRGITTANAGGHTIPAERNRGTVAAGKPGAIPGVTHGPLAHPAARGMVEHSNAAGLARMRADGHPADVHNARLGMDIHHSLGGGRRIESVRPDGRRFVSERGRPGYIGRPYAFRGHDFERRAYYDHGRAYNRYYGAFRYRGYDMRFYAPGRYYSAAYYGWAYNPWRVPVRYGWGFEARPWYGYYGAYYTPYPVYPSASLWLTDYMLSQTLAAAYQARMEAGADAGPAQAAYSGPPLTAEAKQMVANEVQTDINYENAQAALNQQQGVPDVVSNSVERLMDGKAHAFVAGREVDVIDASGTECAITDGDVVQLPPGPPSQDTTVNVIVMASKGGKDCARGAQVAIGIDELQEMDNHMREQVDAGLQQLASEQGKNGLPAAPAAALAPPSEAAIAQAAPPAEPNGAQELAQQEAQAQQAENEVLSASGAVPAAPAPTPPSSNEDLFKTPHI